MILDPDNQYIQAINSQIPLAGATVLEIGCGEGRITRDMAKYATRIVATDLNLAALEQAKKNTTAKNIEFLYSSDGIPDFPKNSFDTAIYTLSLHHIPKNKMVDNLCRSGSLLKNGGKIVVVEPGDGGSFMELKKRFGVGSGDESQERLDAIAAMQNFEGWTLFPTYHFEVAFQFADENDFFSNKVPNGSKMATEEIAELKKYLKKSSTDRGIILTSARRLNLLTQKVF
ncbi:MAG: class I SAM-dependent methyltransferase [Desulfuromusa sp.]|jgi:ubiquinone/menaquinone biosynthesis C-methylase UbiE|nr:class I SAM-dependent methyltransferase [Desulfuromusa sp.]